MFKCKHPFERLSVEKDATMDSADADFLYISYHFSCNKCGEKLTKKYAKMIGGVEGFMSRGIAANFGEGDD